VAVETEAGPDQLVEMARQIVGEIEGGELIVGLGCKFRIAGKEGIAMGAVDALHALFFQHFVEQAAGSAIALWTALHVMLTAVIGVMASRLVSFGRWALLFAALVVSLPPFRTVMQFSIASFAPALAGFLLADRYPRLAGAAIGISLIKPQIGGPFLLWAIAARRWKTVGMAIAVPAALFALYLVRALRAPQHVVREWLEAIGRGHNHPDLTGGEINLQPLLAWISMPPLGIQMLIATVLALGLLIIWQRRQDDFDLRFLAAACLLSLLSVRHLSYDLLLAIPALAFVWSRDGRGARLLAAGAFAVLIVSPPSLYRHYFEPRFITTPADALLVHAYRIVAMALFAFTLLSTSSRRRFDTI